MGVISLGKSYKDDATAGFGHLAELEKGRNAANKQLAAADDAQATSTVTSGAGLGMAVGLGSEWMGAQFGAMAGPVGMLLGGGLGLLASKLF